MKKLTGRIIALNSARTASVAVERVAKHPKYKKRLKRMKKYKVHFDKTSLKVGDQVTIVESRPLSKDKHWRILNS